MKKFISLLPLCLLLVGCGETSSVISSVEASSTSSVVESSQEESSVEESMESSSEESSIEAKSYSLSYSDIPTNEKGGYPEDSTITASDGGTYYIHQCMQGSGDYANTIQMRKETSYLFNTIAMKGTLTFTINRKIVAYNNQDVTGIPTLYVGSEAHPSETATTLTETVAEDGNSKTFTAAIDGYFTLADESSYAMYITRFTIQA